MKKLLVAAGLVAFLAWSCVEQKNFDADCRASGGAVVYRDTMSAPTCAPKP